MANDMDVASSPSTPNPSPPLSTSLSSSELRFPVASADGSIGDLVIDTLPNTMHTHIDHDEESLAGSTYEFVDTDVESRDGHTTASIASTDVGRPDDVASLADTEQSEEESADEEDEPSASISTASRSLEQTSVLETPTIGRSSAAFFDEPQARSIEFDEFYATGAETVSVKHTVEEFSEELTRHTVQRLNLQDAPRQLSLTIRQTMTRSGLTTKDPLRVLYVGSHAARQDIVTKVASCLSASNSQGSKYYQSQIYNVVPVSASAEEVELMQSSGLQIKVEDCVDAVSMPYEDDTEKPEIIKLRLTESGPYHSVPDHDSFIVEPTWELPHVAIFYCSNSDTSTAKQTRSLVRKFMNRHGVPSVVITHQIILDRSLCLSLDQHAVHMCLEARDTKGRGNIIRHRLPIDLTSFLNIDARQMSRNLAYITGLHESSKRINTRAEHTPARRTSDLQQLKGDGRSAELHDYPPLMNYRHLLPLGMLLLSVIAAVITSLPAYRFTSSPAISVNSETVQPIIPSTTSQINIISSVPVISSTATSSAAQVSSKVTKDKQPPRPNSLSVLSSREVRIVPVALPRPTKADKTACSVEIAGDREILVHVPGTTRPRWLSRDAISVNITRNNLTVNTEHVYNLDQGIVLMLPVHETYGVLDISISTTKKPRINATFQVDFGTTRAQAFHNIRSRISSILTYDKVSLDQMLQQVQDIADEIMGQARAKLLNVEESTVEATKKISTVGSAIINTAKLRSSEFTQGGMALSKDIGCLAGNYVSATTASFKRLGGPAQEALLKAQIQSKLTWLKMQGHTAKYDEYKQRALAAMNARRDG